MGIWKGSIGAAETIRAELIDVLLNNEKDTCDLIVNELPFLRGNRWADVVAIKNGMTFAYEIKSERDRLEKLQAQLSDYVKVFNQVYLVIAEKFKNDDEVLNISKNIGILIERKDRKIILKRKPKMKILLNKQAMLSLLWRKDLEILTNKRKNIEMDELIATALKKCSIKEIQKQIISSLNERYGNSYNLFLKDRGKYTTVEDLRTITKLSKPLVF